MTQITYRDKRVLVAGGTLTILLLFFVFVAQPVYQEDKKVQRQIQDKILFIQKCYEILNQKSYYKAKNTENKVMRTALHQRFFKQSKPALAAAEQQHLIEGLANQTGVNIIRFQVDKPKYVEGLLTISTMVTIRSKLRNLTNFIKKLENNSKFMVIEEMAVQRINEKDLEELQAHFTVSGFVKSMEIEKKKSA